MRARLAAAAAAADDPHAGERLQRFDTAQATIERRAEMAAAEPKPAGPEAAAPPQRQGDARIRPLSEFIEQAKAAGRQSSEPSSWPTARELAAPGPHHEPDGAQREVRVLVTGSQQWLGRDAVEGNLDRLRERADGAPLRVITGNRRGAEAFAYEWTEANDVPVEVYETDWDREGRGAAYRRNERIDAEVNADVVMIFTRRADPVTADIIDKFSAKQTPIEAPLTARLTRSPTGELANLAAASRTPTQAQRDARAETAAAADRQAAPTRSTAPPEAPERRSAPPAPPVSLTVEPQRGLPAAPWAGR